jgi:hypothetical protein
MGDLMNEMTQEKVLEVKKNDVVAQANAITVTGKESYDFAMDFLKNIKSVGKNISEYWAEPKKKANEAWKVICAKEKEMLSPLEQAEATIKTKMKNYADEQARIEREIQRKQEEARRIEADRLMKEAAEAESQGDTLQAEINMQMAATMETPQAFTGNTTQAGTRQVKTIKISDESKIPCYVNGICIRPVDMVAVKKLYSLTGVLPEGLEIVIETQIVAR